MAALVSALAAGIVGAPSGSVEFFTSGTSVLSTAVYADADGQTAVTSHDLDVDGSVIRYVNERVDVVVYDVDGHVVRQFTEGTDARLVRVESPGFTGPNDVGQVVAGGRTTVQNVLGLFYESLGAVDAQVALSGIPTPLKNALSTTAGVFLNVKTLYGATGNGTTDDTSAIQQAINAAYAAGGGTVYFPSGSYLITSTLQWGSNTAVTLLGSSSSPTAPSATRIVANTAGFASGMLSVIGSGSVISNINWIVGSSAATEIVNITGGAKYITFRECSFLGGAAPLIRLGGPTSGIVTNFDNCSFSISHVSGQFFVGGLAAKVTASITGCAFDTSVVTTSPCFGDTNVNMSSCQMLMSSTSGGATLFGTSSSSRRVLSGCSIYSGNTSGTNTFFDGGINSVSGCDFQVSSGAVNWASANATTTTESGCSIPSTVLGFTAAVNNGISLSRESRPIPTTVNGTSYTPDVNYGVHEVSHASGASMAFNNPAAYFLPLNASLTIIYKNATGGSITPTWGTQYSGVPATAVTNGSTALYKFQKCVVVGSTSEWVAVTTNPVVSAA